MIHPLTLPHLLNVGLNRMTLGIDQILWEEKNTQSALIRLNIGPGMLGLFLKQEPRQLVHVSPGEPALFEEVVYVDSEKSVTLNGCVSHVINTIPYLNKNPAIIELNRTFMNVVLSRNTTGWNVIKTGYHSLSKFTSSIISLTSSGCSQESSFHSFFYARMF